MTENDLEEHKKLEVLLALKNGDIPKAVAIIHLELKCGLRTAKELADEMKKRI